MTITISTKEAIYLSLVALVLIVLGISVFAFRGNITESGQPKIEATAARIDAVDSDKQLRNLPGALPITNQPHPSCYLRLTFGPKLPNYNGSNPYNVAFMGQGGLSQPGATLQDINGDNLPDYVYVRNVTDESSASLTSQHIACIYLNNGGGWSKAYECYGLTVTDAAGNQTTHEYAGDCARP